MRGVDIVIDLSKEFTAVAAEGQSVAVAQLVYTATEGRNVTNVQFSVDGQLYEVPGDDGVVRPSLKRADFRSYEPSTATTTTTSPQPSDDTNGRR